MGSAQEVRHCTSTCVSLAESINPSGPLADCLVADVLHDDGRNVAESSENDVYCLWVDTYYYIIHGHVVEHAIP